MTSYTLRHEDDIYYVDPTPQYAVTDLVWVVNKQPDAISGWRDEVAVMPCAYIEPCGLTPDGLFFPAAAIPMLLALDAIAPHAYDDSEREALVKAEGIAFDIVGDSESDEGLRNLRIIETEGERAINKALRA